MLKFKYLESIQQNIIQITGTDVEASFQRENTKIHNEKQLKISKN